MASLAGVLAVAGVASVRRGDGSAASSLYSTCDDNDDCSSGYRCAGGMCISLDRTTDDDVASAASTDSSTESSSSSSSSGVDDDQPPAQASGDDDDKPPAEDDMGFHIGNSSALMNVTKMTWAVTDPVSARRWFRKYLSVAKATDGCTPTCSCGTQGRVELNGTVLGYQSMFGLHTVDAFTKPSGPQTLGSIEAVYDFKLGSLSNYVDVMDFHIGLFALDLDLWLDAVRRVDNDRIHIIHDENSTIARFLRFALAAEQNQPLRRTRESRR